MESSDTEKHETKSWISEIYIAPPDSKMTGNVMHITIPNREVLSRARRTQLSCGVLSH